MESHPLPSSIEERPVGLVGLGLLGRGIAACLLAHGFRVVAFDTNPAQYPEARRHIAEAVDELVLKGGYPGGLRDQWPRRLRTADSIEALSGCGFVIESAVEDIEAKAALFSQLEDIVAPNVPIASNTSAIPISLLQKPGRHPGRFVGMHWGEPCHILRFLEVIRGEQTSEETFAVTVALGRRLGKNPVLVQKDIRGFITNRLMYAMLREAFHLLESGVGDAETIDNAFRSDIGWWATLAGPFRWMDLTGLPAYAAVMRDLFPDLDNSVAEPETMRKLVESGADGVRNGRGFYRYTPEEARDWERRWRDFSWEMRRLTEKYRTEKES